MELIPWVLNGLLGLVMYFLKATSDSTKLELKELRHSLDTVKDTYFKKEDFREFKEELWRRFDKVEKTIQEQIK